MLLLAKTGICPERVARAIPFLAVVASQLQKIEEVGLCGGTTVVQKKVKSQATLHSLFQAELLPWLCRPRVPLIVLEYDPFGGFRAASLRLGVVLLRVHCCGAAAFPAHPVFACVGGAKVLSGRCGCINRCSAAAAEHCAGALLRLLQDASGQVMWRFSGVPSRYEQLPPPRE